MTTDPHKKQLSFLRRLLTRRRQLSAAIAAETQKSRPDTLHLLRLKKLRLAIKDRMRALFRQRRGGGTHARA